jgi:hypothetical protein
MQAPATVVATVGRDVRVVAAGAVVVAVVVVAKAPHCPPLAAATSTVAAMHGPMARTPVAMTFRAMMRSRSRSPAPNRASNRILKPAPTCARIGTPSRAHPGQRQS